MSSLDTLDAFQEILIFKHSRSCPTSLRALSEVRNFMEEDPNNTPIIMVDVLSERSLSMEISARLSLRHESPQIIYLKEGKMLWNDSHIGVTAMKIRTAIASLDMGSINMKR